MHKFKSSLDDSVLLLWIHSKASRRRSRRRQWWLKEYEEWLIVIATRNAMQAAAVHNIFIWNPLPPPQTTCWSAYRSWSSAARTTRRRGCRWTQATLPARWSARLSRRGRRCRAAAAWTDAWRCRRRATRKRSTKAIQRISDKCWHRAPLFSRRRWNYKNKHFFIASRFECDFEAKIFFSLSLISSFRSSWGMTGSSSCSSSSVVDSKRVAAVVERKFVTFDSVVSSSKTVPKNYFSLGSLRKSTPLALEVHVGGKHDNRQQRKDDSDDGWGIPAIWQVEHRRKLLNRQHFSGLQLHNTPAS